MAADALPIPFQQVPELTHLQKAQLEIVDYLADGLEYRELAEKMGRGNETKARKWRMKIRSWAAADPFFQQSLALATTAELNLGLPLTGRALVRRARKGYVPAIKLLFEASGFYRPTEKHEHSGEIKITVQGMARPPEVEDQVVDATVVDD